MGVAAPRGRAGRRVTDSCNYYLRRNIVSDMFLNKINIIILVATTFGNTTDLNGES